MAIVVSWALQLGATTDGFSPLAAYTPPSNTMRTCPQGGGLHVRPSLIHPMPLS